MSKEEEYFKLSEYLRKELEKSQDEVRRLNLRKDKVGPYGESYGNLTKEDFEKHRAHLNKIMLSEKDMEILVEVINSRPKPNSKLVEAVNESLDSPSTGKIVRRQKDTAGKPDLTLIPYKSLVAVAKVREYGNKKYGDPWLWREKTSKEDFVRAALRHILKYTDPAESVIDAESSLNHLHHAACSLLMAIDLEK